MRRAMSYPDASAFEGTWHIIPGRCVFEYDTPPREGTYRITLTPDGLVFTLDWVDDAGAVSHREFRLTWDDDIPASLELVDENTLNTTIEQDDRVVGHASRRLSEDRSQMEIVQHGYNREGKAFVNRIWYQRAT